ncbi:MAG: hypothetical protein P8X98_11105 [Woeseiaceae bacterium]
MKKEPLLVTVVLLTGIVSGCAGPEGSQAMVGGSRSAVLLKPFSLNDLARSLRGLIGDAGTVSPGT